MKKTLDEYFDSTPNLKLLRVNLETNLKAMTDLNQNEMDTLMRVNLTVIRQAMDLCLSPKTIFPEELDKRMGIFNNPSFRCEGSKYSHRWVDSVDGRICVLCGVSE